MESIECVSRNAVQLRSKAIELCVPGSCLRGQYDQ